MAPGAQHGHAHLAGLLHLGQELQPSMRLQGDPKGKGSQLLPTFTLWGLAKGPQPLLMAAVSAELSFRVWIILLASYFSDCFLDLPLLDHLPSNSSEPCLDC